MTIGEAIRQLDAIKPNAVDRTTKVRWLEEVDFAVYRELVMTHEHGQSLIFNGSQPRGRERRGRQAAAGREAV